MNNGVYLIANDKVTEQAIAMVKSLRIYEPDIPIVMIPFDNQYQQVATRLAAQEVTVFPDLEFVENFTQKIREIFPEDFLALPNKMRKFVQWFGPLDKFIYIDTDIVLFQDLSEIFAYLSNYEFICCDYHHKGKKLQDIFTPTIESIFTQSELGDVFNSGFWASRKGIFDETQLYSLLADCAQHREYFDFSSKTTDQPILNYIVLKSTQKRLNLTKTEIKEPGSWAGSPNFTSQEHILYDKNQRLRYIHWAGIAIKPGCPYWDIWQHYRYLGESPPKGKFTLSNLLNKLKLSH